MKKAQIKNVRPKELEARKSVSKIPKITLPEDKVRTCSALWHAKRQVPKTRNFLPKNGKRSSWKAKIGSLP